MFRALSSENLVVEERPLDLGFPEESVALDPFSSSGSVARGVSSAPSPGPRAAASLPPATQSAPRPGHRLPPATKSREVDFLGFGPTAFWFPKLNI